MRKAVCCSILFLVSLPNSFPHGVVTVAALVRTRNSSLGSQPCSSRYRRISICLLRSCGDRFMEKRVMTCEIIAFEMPSLPKPEK
ncbi:hypothetical protein B0T24DRAFT_627158 [Lasiosphaeria ovina]|uniref:Secreted protein n=1 Tax=Lasiosphaeria ovina TaxID=92902 RepID=A0AAE0N642_9PEZI|nr:hypothetical protein B0T24DRAFT_627158 [Lasiosphaeria ovina]